ncbi:MAG: hypothetical protein OHK0038_09350 [Flammeovirgaceae bacterium]
MILREENIRLIFGLKVKMLRQEKKMSLAELAKQTDISMSYLNEIEKGKKYPKGHKIHALAEALGTNYDWLVSLKMSKKLDPLSNLLQSNILHDLPLEVFGLSPSSVVELMSDAPIKLNAFINTLAEIARSYDLTLEGFYGSVLRTYQEMHENYFEEIEQKATQFRRQFLKNQKPTSAKLFDYLQKEWGYELDENSLDRFEDLHNFRAVLKTDDNRNLLIINPKLSETQKAFIYGREIGFQLMNLTERSYTYSWTSINSFDQLLNNFKAAYFAGALMIAEQDLIQDLEEFFNQKYWDGNQFLKIMERHGASPEMFLHRITSIAPKYFGLNRLFFLRLEHKPNENEYTLTKELHLSGLHSPHGTVIGEHYCRRWISVKILNEIEHSKEKNNSLCRAQISKYITSGKEYFCISLAKHLFPTPASDVSLTLGFEINQEFKERCHFWNDPKVVVEMVNDTCERCPATDCQARAASPSILERQQKDKKIKTALKNLLKQV